MMALVLSVNSSLSFVENLQTTGYKEKQTAAGINIYEGMAQNNQSDKLPPAKNTVMCNFQAPFTILNKYGKRLRSDEHGKSLVTGGTSSSSLVSSAVSIMRMAEMVTSQTSSLSKSSGFDSDIARSHGKHLKRVLWLLDAAEKFSIRLYDQAEEFLKCVLSTTSSDHPIDRVVAVYARYLWERVDAERCRFDLEREVEYMDVEQALVDLKAAVLECQQKLPFSQISHFSGMQTILDTVAAAERIHLIDFGRKLQSYWIILIDALANRKNHHVKLLKITAVCSPRDNVEEIGKLLSSSANSMNLPFAFNILYSEMGELEKDRLQLEAGETVAVYLEFCLISSLARPQSIEALLRGIKSLNPLVMVVSDFEVNTSASAFAARFREALLLSCAMSDSLEACLERDSHYKKVAEKLHFQQIICNCVLSEDDDGFNQCYKIDFWREYFSKLGIVETELSQTSKDLARLMIRECCFWSCCSLSMNGKCMVIGWNGVPLRFLSAWKFK